MNIYFILIPVIILVIILVIFLILKSKKNNEEQVSILDINNVGVSAESDEFSYGYEKEATVVMNPINEETSMKKEKEEINKEESEE